MSLLRQSRPWFFLCFLAAIALMGFGFYLQYVEGLEVCPLCMTQRVFIVLCGAVGLFACLHNPGRLGVNLYALLLLGSAAIGGGFAGRHLWLQSLPADQVPACGPSLQYLLDTLPFTEALSTLIMGDGNCAQVTWTMLGLSIPAWALIGFLGFATVAIGQMLAGNRAGQKLADN